jgi:hypothetical protein
MLSNRLSKHRRLDAHQEKVHNIDGFGIQRHEVEVRHTERPGAAIERIAGRARNSIASVA